MKRSKKIEISIVVPVFNEAENITELHQQLIKSLNRTKKSYEIIIVDDGSTDNSRKILSNLKPLTIVTLRRNFGQTAALDAGIKQASGKYLVTLDGDLQNDPKDIPKMLNMLIKYDVDVVCGWRKKRKDNWSKKLISNSARWLRYKIIHDGVKDSGCTLRVYKIDCFKNLTLRGEMHRFIPAILKWRGFKIREIAVNHRSRKKGKSKYTITRTIKGFLDILFSLVFPKIFVKAITFTRYVRLHFRNGRFMHSSNIICIKSILWS